VRASASTKFGHRIPITALQSVKPPRFETQQAADLRLFEIASALVRLDHVASFIVNANDCVM
jgi:hypothetical protein